MRVDTPTVLKPGTKRATKRPEVPRLIRTYRMLDLFSGTGSVGRVFKDLGYEVISVDFDPKRNPTIVVDITIWQYWKAFQACYFDVVGCCPPCTEFSRAMTSRPRDLAKADGAVKAALEIVDYLQPLFWFLENARTGILKEREYMKRLPYVDVDYCRCADWGYQKPTRIWGSPCLRSLPSKECNRDCGNMAFNAAGRWCHKSKLGTTPDPGKRNPSQTEAYRVPAGVIMYILEAYPEMKEGRPKEPEGGTGK